VINGVLFSTYQSQVSIAREFVPESSNIHYCDFEVGNKVTFEHKPKGFLDRIILFLQEVDRIILFLQEVDHFEEVQEDLSILGYEGIFQGMASKSCQIVARPWP
jgi:hypothetical protein